jgi:hypothetical protein
MATSEAAGGCFIISWVSIVIEAHQAGLGDRRRHRVEAVEPARIGNELRPLDFEHAPDRLPGQLWMRMLFGVGDAFIEQPSVQAVVALEPQPPREEALADKPARTRGAVAMNAMPALMNGTFSPYCSVMRVFNMKFFRVAPSTRLFNPRSQTQTPRRAGNVIHFISSKPTSCMKTVSLESFRRLEP